MLGSEGGEVYEMKGVQTMNRQEMKNRNRNKYADYISSQRQKRADAPYILAQVLEKIVNSTKPSNSPELLKMLEEAKEPWESKWPE